MNQKTIDRVSPNQNWISVFHSFLDFYSKRLSDFGNRIIPAIVLISGSFTALLANIPNFGSAFWLPGLFGYLISGMALYALVRQVLAPSTSKFVITIVLTIVGFVSLGFALPFVDLTLVPYQILSVLGFCAGFHFIITYWGFSRRSRKRFGEIIWILRKLSERESVNEKWLLDRYNEMLCKVQEDSAPLTTWLEDKKEKLARIRER